MIFCAMSGALATPDVYESDVTYPPKFARAGWPSTWPGSVPT